MSYELPDMHDNPADWPLSCGVCGKPVRSDRVFGSLYDETSILCSDQCVFDFNERFNVVTALTARDGRAILNGEAEQRIEFPSGILEIVGPDGRTLFQVRLLDLRAIEIRANDVTKDETGRLVDDTLIIEPRATNCVVLRRPLYDTGAGA